MRIRCLRKPGQISINDQLLLNVEGRMNSFRSVSVKVLSLSMLLAVALLIIVSGCGGGGGGGSTSIPGGADTPAAIVTGRVLREVLPLSERSTLAGSAVLEGVAGAEVWIEALAHDPNYHAITDASGTYIFRNVPPSVHRIVGKLIVSGGNAVIKNRSLEFQNSSSSGSDVVVHDLILKKATNYVTGRLSDSEGKYLPPGTELSLWGETFKVLADGRFISPPLPSEVIEAQVFRTSPVRLHIRLLRQTVPVATIW